MYAGSLLEQLPDLDRWFGTHQKIDRLAFRELQKVMAHAQDVAFPDIEAILKFEGRDGPDGIKMKSPAQDEPWHFYNPLDANDTMLLDIIADHQTKLTAALRANSQTQASFQAAWLAHAVVDGLTPAHHYPYESELEKLRGAGKESRNSTKGKLLVPGETKRKMVRNNWQMWGDKGLLATHLAFEMGVALVILPVRLRDFALPPKQAARIKNKELYRTFYRTQAKRVAGLKLYEQFYRSGWTPRYAAAIRKQLVPLIVEAVVLAWYAAYTEAAKK